MLFYTIGTVKSKFTRFSDYTGIDHTQISTEVWKDGYIFYFIYQNEIIFKVGMIIIV
jgi:hypothetical protein